MKRIKEVIVVEGKYDKIALGNVVDATIVTTEGFGIFRDRDKQAMLRRLADKRGIIVLTDADGAGFLIRSKLSGIIKPDKIKHAYIPDIDGKERRKDKPSKEGTLGVEGMSPEVLLHALISAGATVEDGDEIRYSSEITKADLFILGLSGGNNSSIKRKALQKELLLPEKLSANALLSVLNIITTKAELKEIIDSIDTEG